VEYRAGTPIYAFVLAVVSGTLFAAGHYVSGGITALTAIVLFALWRFANERGDDRHTIW
jgi:protein-S-isoprenylcysteine O-methyltransferase Ste14